MTDNKQKTAKPDRDRINLSEKYEVQYWTKNFDVTADQLKDAVKAVGDRAISVEKYLNDKK